MCRFKSGIILKNRCVVAEGFNESHSDLLEKLNIEDSWKNAVRAFVRAELLPPNDEWWTDPDTWEINIDQDEVPDWFEESREKYVENFREAVKDWWKKHVFIDKKILSLSEGSYWLKGCEIDYLSGNVQAVLKQSTVGYVKKDAIINSMTDSTIYSINGNARIKFMLNSSRIEEMGGESIVENMQDKSRIDVMRIDSMVREMHDSAQVDRMFGYSKILTMDGESKANFMLNRSMIENMGGNAYVMEMYNDSVIRFMTADAKVYAMYERSIVQNMCKDAQIMRMQDNSTICYMQNPDNVQKMENRSTIVCTAKDDNVRAASDAQRTIIMHETE